MSIKFLSVLFSLLLVAAGREAMALEEPPQLHFVVKEFRITGDSPLPEDTTRKLLEKFTGDHYGLEGLQAAAEELERAFRAEGYTFYRVTLVPQKLKDGVITLAITEFTIDGIRITGNEHFSDANIMRNLPTLEQGRAPNTAILSRALNQANTQPSKSLKLQFAESESGGAIDANVQVSDRPPNYFFAALNNTGTDETGKWRLTGGYQMSNLFDRDHNLSLTYTLSPSDLSAVKQYGLFYKVPFYASGSRFSLLLARSDVDSGVVAQNFEISGAGTIALLRYAKTLLQQGAYKQEFEFGLDYKLFDNEVTFAGLPAAGDGKVLSRPASVAYTGLWSSAGISLDFNIGAFVNLPGGTNNEDSDYANLRQGATADWSSLHYSGSYNHVLAENWFLRAKIAGQHTSDPLISGEQFGIGGIYSVRGFEERTLLGDRGYQLNLELWGPGIWDIRPIVFYDMGHVEVIDPLPGTPAEHDIASAGIGLRWNRGDELSLVLDGGYVLDGDEFSQQQTEEGDVRGHFNLYYRF